MKKYHNKLKYLVFALAFCVLYISGCGNDDNVIVNPPPAFSTGSANFTMYVSIGNSLTAGFQSKALSQRDQAWSFPSMLARQVQAAGTFEQPLIKNPGIGGRLRLKKLNDGKGNPVIETESSVPPTGSSNLNIALARPYNNLGIPGSILFDMADESDFGVKSVARENPFFSLVLRNPALGTNVINQARTLQATFVTVWIGNNDVLGYATSGGTSGTNAGLFDPPKTKPTETQVFSPLYKAMLDSLQADPRDIVVANIPDVSTIPFFTTIGPKIATNPKINWTAIAAGHAAAGLPGTGIIYVKKTGLNIGLPFNLGFSDSSSTRNGTALFTLIGGTAAGLLGDTTGVFYDSTGVPPGVNTTQPFGFSPFNPFPDAFILDPDEITVAKTAVDAFNAIIAAEAGSRNIAVVDFNSFLKNLQTGGGISVPGIGVFSSSFISGGTFSYDGVHPSSRGYGIIANEWIKVINQKFGATIPPVDLNSLPAMPIGKLASGKFPNYPAGYFDNYIRMITGDRNWTSSN